MYCTNIAFTGELVRRLFKKKKALYLFQSHVAYTFLFLRFLLIVVSEQISIHELLNNSIRDRFV